MEEFLKKYKQFDTKKLLRILEKSEDYQRMAVLAAEIELESRVVSQIEIDEVKKEIKEVVAVFLGFLWFISQPDVKAVFKIERRTAILTFGLSFIIAVLMRILIQ